MAQNPNKFHHPHDTPLSAGLRFLSELIAWIAGPWAISLVSIWLVLPAIVVLIGLPSVFSTQNDKRNVVVSTPGSMRVGIELLLYLVAIITPWLIWAKWLSGLATGIVVLAFITGWPRFIWLINGAPSEE